jgi:hypothetical protein
MVREVGAPMRPLARLCWVLHARRRLLIALDLGGALLFVIGCVAFYLPPQNTLAVTFFLIGSVLMLMSATGRALLEYGPSE